MQHVRSPTNVTVRLELVAQYGISWLGIVAHKLNGNLMFQYLFLSRVRVFARFLSVHFWPDA